MTARTACRNAPKNYCITKHNEKPPGIRWLLQFLFCQTSENFQSWKFSRTCAAVLQLLLYSSQVPSIRLDQLRPMEAIIFKTSVRTSAG